ncbi:hypothetical protein PRUPE_6G103000 [Prunus persica]|uniref:Uncharacterized protein n=1 Tax=Prunus persica TaxID=3760 RepID=A0A251NN35_PRUPE|nr:hypothetical protein PRUPE_6G103000 [Prunus persica]
MVGAQTSLTFRAVCLSPTTVYDHETSNFNISAQLQFPSPMTMTFRMLTLILSTTILDDCGTTYGSV